MSGKFPVQKSTKEWKEALSSEEYKVLRNAGTEPAGCGEYNRVYPKSGYFGCRGCAHPIYSVTAKFPDSGWVAFDQCYYSKEGKCHVGVQSDLGGIEIICNNCGGHLGHVFYGEKHTAKNERH
mmetsp:Transcript_13740/g.24817  ORF Transcript_13740/g.24817 Transcript_13740/m.24817 type:complete len:123 (-) Transcript_13740:585-953(-)